MEAGNTVENLFGVDRDAAVAANQAPASEVAADEGDILDEENTFDVSRKEFAELQEAFLRLVVRVNDFNKVSPVKI